MNSIFSTPLPFTFFETCLLNDIACWFKYISIGPGRQPSSTTFCKTCYNIVILHLYIAMVQSVAIELWYPCILLEQKKTFLLKYFLFINSSKTKDITAHGGIQTLLSLRKGLALIVTYNLLWVTVPIRH